MKLWILSDLHLEVEQLEEPLVAPPGADICIMAGDLTNKSPAHGIEWIKKNIPLPTVYVAGNHEFYRGSVVEGHKLAKWAAGECPDIHFLENDFVVIGGVRFIGATLWTDFRLMGSPFDAMEYARFAMNDYKVISWQKDPWTRFTPKHALDMHRKSRVFVDSLLRTPFDGPTVVVTHHGPHPWSVHDKYRGQLLNAAFSSDLHDVIEQGRPDLWVHGHTHDSFDYEVEGTRVICNPRGYGRENPAFDRGLVIDLAGLTPRLAGKRAE